MTDFEKYVDLCNKADEMTKEGELMEKCLRAKLMESIFFGKASDEYMPNHSYDVDCFISGASILQADILCFRRMQDIVHTDPVELRTLSEKLQRLMETVQNVQRAEFRITSAEIDDGIDECERLLDEIAAIE